MKAIAFVVLALALTTTAHAKEVTGANADQLLETLEQAGAVSDSGMGRMGTTAANVVCSGEANELFTGHCTADLQDASGGMTKAKISIKTSQVLVQLLTQVGEFSCHSGHCNLVAKSIDCTSRSTQKMARRRLAR